MDERRRMRLSILGLAGVLGVSLWHLVTGLAVVAGVGVAASAMGAGVASSLPAPVRTPKQAEAEAQLQALKARIQQVRDTVAHDAIESDRLTKALATAETDASAARGQLDDLRRERAGNDARRDALSAERKQIETRLGGQRQALALQLRLAWRLSQQAPLTLLLNQQDPARVGRMFTYYGYFGRARAAQLATIQGNLKRLSDLDGELAVQEQQLATLESRNTAELAKLDTARAERGAALRNIKAESRDSEQLLQRLLAEQTALAELLRQLAAAQEQFPLDQGAFEGLRGRLAWPVAGHLAARYGDTRAGGLKWDGMLIDTERGADVRAVYGGRVIYADWLPGLGLLAIIDHGGGWLSLYGHNDRLFKTVGEMVRAGDIIAGSGDSGGGGHPELYFGLRKGSRPQDPGPWFKRAQPLVPPRALQ